MHALIQTHGVALLVTLAPGSSGLARGGLLLDAQELLGRRAAVKPGPEADRVLLEHMRDWLNRIAEDTKAERSCFEASRLVQDAVIRNLQTLVERSQRLSIEIKTTEPQIPWRELSWFRNVTRRSVVLAHQLHVSTHAPPRGATQGAQRVGRAQLVSTHAPARGATASPQAIDSQRVDAARLRAYSEQSSSFLGCCMRRAFIPFTSGVRAFGAEPRRSGFASSEYQRT